MAAKRVFFIEDEKEIADLYSSVLENQGYDVISFNNGSEALSEINSIAEGKSPAPEAMVLDLLLPDVSGLAVLGELRGKTIFDGVFIVVLTNYVSESLEESVKQMGNVEYLSKVDTTPVSLLDVLKARIG
jgi:DNA-binding response OmpR family regulator